MARFNVPPGWPATPEGWQPPPGWQPPSSWPPAPSGWQFWVDDQPLAVSAGPRVIVRKLANFLVEDAALDPNPAADAVLGLAGGQSAGTDPVLVRFAPATGDSG
jgi:hypothetical protein